MPINWQYFPKSDRHPPDLQKVTDAFVKNQARIDSELHTLSSNDVLAVVRNDLITAGFQVEDRSSRIHMPVLFGRQGKTEKTFDVDAWNRATATVVEVEAGRAVTNNQFLKDIFEASVMEGIDYLVIAVRNLYSRNHDFDTVTTFLETLYTTQRLRLELTGILAIGY